MSNTVYVRVAGELIPYTKKDIRGMFESQIRIIKRNLVNKEDCKTIDKWLAPEPKE